MDKKQFLERLREGRAEWERLLAQVPDDQMTVAGVVGVWTMKDLIAHVSWFEREMVGLLQGRTLLNSSELWLREGDERNRAIYEQNQDRALEEVLAEAHSLAEELIRLAATLSEEELVDPSRFEGMPQDWVPWRLIADNTFEHYEHHTPNVWAWLEGGTLILKPDKTSVAQAVVDALIAERVEFVFGLAGTHVLPLFDALADAPQVRHVVTKHESNAAFMAGMVGFLSGCPGVAMVTAGPGATNSLTGVAQAYAASLPLVHISGDVPLHAGNEAYHGVDRRDFLHRMFADVTKWSVRVERPHEIPDILSRAFAAAASGRPGPVHVDIPWDIVGAPFVQAAPYKARPVEKHAPPEELVEQARQALSAARRPLICAGRGVLVQRAEAELLALAEALSAPVLCTSYGDGAIPHDHPLFVGRFSEWRGNPFAWDLLAESDLLLAVGLRSDTRTTDVLMQQASPQTILAALDEPHTLRPTAGINMAAACDSQLFLARLLDQADALRRSPDPSLQARIARHWAAWKRGLARHLAALKDSEPLHFGCVLQELAGRLDEDALLLGGVGNHALWARAILPVRDRESYIEETSWGTMGGELGGGIAAKLVYPERQVVVVTGDGSLLMAAPDIVTAVEAGANLLIVVLNDSRYGIITAIQQRQFQRSFGDEIGVIDFARWAESVGAAGVRVTSPAALPEAMTRALALSAETPVILDVVCSHAYRWPDWDVILAASAEEKTTKQ